MALYLQLDVNWPDDDPIIEVGLEAAGLHAMLMCLAKRLETDGWVSRALLNRYGATDALVALLAGSTPPLIEVDGNRVRPSGWLKWNPSKAALDARRSAKSEAGRKGNHVRHRHGGDYEFRQRSTHPGSHLRMEDCMTTCQLHHDMVTSPVGEMRKLCELVGLIVRSKK